MISIFYAISVCILLIRANPISELNLNNNEDDWAAQCREAIEQYNRNGDNCQAGSGSERQTGPGPISQTDDEYDVPSPPSSYLPARMPPQGCTSRISDPELSATSGEIHSPIEFLKAPRSSCFSNSQIQALRDAADRNVDSDVPPSEQQNDYTPDWSQMNEQDIFNALKQSYNQDGAQGGLCDDKQVSDNNYSKRRMMPALNVPYPPTAQSSNFETQQGIDEPTLQAIRSVALDKNCAEGEEQVTTQQPLPPLDSGESDGSGPTAEPYAPPITCNKINDQTCQRRMPLQWDSIDKSTVDSQLSNLLRQLM